MSEGYILKVSKLDTLSYLYLPGGWCNIMGVLGGYPLSLK